MYTASLEFFSLFHGEKEVDCLSGIDCCPGNGRSRGELGNAQRVGFIYEFNEISCSLPEVNGVGNVPFCI